MGARRRPGVALLLMTASGFAGLGDQIVWTQQCSAWLGHEAAAVLAVVTAFFGGLAVGALALGGRIERSLHPAGWYAACELGVAAWSAVLLVLLPAISPWLLKAIGATPAPAWQWTVAFAGTFVLLLPATAAMGATLPAMERVALRPRELGPGGDRSIARLYAANTLGAVLGVLATAFWLVPALGLARSGALCIALSALCGLGALAVFRAPPPSPPVRRYAATRAPFPWRLAVTGFLGIGYEVLVVRVLGQVTEGTVYTFAMLLAVYLVGTAAGAAAYQRRLTARPDEEDPSDRLGDALLSALAVACLAGTASLFGAARVKTLAHGALGGGVAGALAAEAALALVAFGPATAVMGAVFSHLCRRAAAAGVTFGRALGVNTLAAAVAPAFWGVVAVPALGPKVALVLVAVGYVASTSRASWRRPSVVAPAAGALALALLAPPLRFVELPEGGRLVSYRDGVLASVSVVADADGVERLRIDNRQQEGSSASLRVDARQAWLPLLLHPTPRRALFLGLGTGVTASAAAEDPTLQVDAVELLPEVIAASARFASVVPDGAARLHVVAADARRYVRASDQRYDVIVSDNFHPARSGSAALYTVEHFEAVQRRLAPGGLFCQWLPLHQLDLPTLRSIVRSFVAVHPRAVALLASNSLETPVLGLVAGGEGGRFDLPALHARLASAARAGRAAALGLEDELAILGSFVAGPESLRRFAAGAPANTDDHPIVAYRAPMVTYAPDASPRDRLIALLAEVSIAPEAALVAAPDVTWSRRLAAYWAARDQFIRSGRGVRPSPRVREMLAQVRQPLLSVLRISPDFRPAYDPLLSMASALARSDAPGARELLGELARLQPARTEAPQLLTALAAPEPR
jgi:spermidine synthase